MAPNYHTCSSVTSRQSLDTGTGRIHVPASYGINREANHDNDSCHDVDANDCPPHYRIMTSYRSDPDIVISDAAAVPDSVLKTNKCWKGGRTDRGSIFSQTTPNNIVGSGLATNNRGGRPEHTHEPHHINNYIKQSNLSRGLDNYSKPCFKNIWSHTNPENGNKMSVGSDDENKSACCGFKESVRNTVKEHYCDPGYCFQKGIGDDSDNITRECANHLLEKCRNWSFIDDLIGFEDERCSDPLSQIANRYNKDRGDLGDFQLNQQDSYTASISHNEYGNIGSELCTVDDFLNNNSSDEIKQKRHDKCISWCKNNSNSCKDKITEVCSAVYHRVNNYPETFPNDLKEYENICACNWPSKFYDNIIEYYKNTYKVSSAAIGTRRKCLFRPCGSSSIKHVDPTASDDVCPQTNFTSCIQSLDIDFTGSDIDGEVNVDGTQSQECGTLADTGAGVENRSLTSPIRGTSQKAVSFDYERGAIVAGNDVMFKKLTLEEAKVEAAGNPEILGFTYEGPQDPDPRQQLEVFFKNTIRKANHDDSWSTFKKTYDSSSTSTILIIAIIFIVILLIGGGGILLF